MNCYAGVKLWLQQTSVMAGSPSVGFSVEAVGFEVNDVRYCTLNPKTQTCVYPDP